MNQPGFSGLALAVATLLQLGALAFLGVVPVLLTATVGMRQDYSQWIGAALAAITALGAGWAAASISRRVGFWEILLASLASIVAGYGVVLLAFHFATVLFSVIPEGAIFFAPVLIGCGLFLFSGIGATVGRMLGAGTRLDLSFGYEGHVAWTHLRLSRRLLLGIAAFALGFVPGLVATIVLLRREKRSPTMIMTVISIGGVAVGVMALCVVLSVMSGFELDLKKKILGTNAHAIVLKFGPFDEWKKAAETARGTEGVIGVTPFILNEVMVTTETNLAGVLIKGIDPESVGDVTELGREIADPVHGEGKLEFLLHPEQIPLAPRLGVGGLDSQKTMDDLREQLRQLEARDRGELAPPEQEAAAAPEGTEARKPAVQEAPPEVNKLPGLVVGRELARQLKVFVGDVVTVVSPIAGELGPLGPQPKSMQFRVAAVFYSGMYEYDSKFVYINLDEAQRFFKLGEAVTGLELKVTEIDDARRISRAVLSRLEGYPYRVKDWGEMNKNLFSALKLEKIVMAVILAFIVLVACFNILSTLVMLVLEKRKEISILKSMGARDGSVMKIFVLEGLCIGTIGTFLGVALGLLLCGLISVFPIPLDPEVYYIPHLPVQMDAMQFFLVGILAIVLAYLATIFPALYASRLSPVDGLRND